MTDDLVKRLRQGDHFEKVMSAAQAADRIEELEAKLAKAVGALKIYADGCDATETTPCGYTGNMCCMTARAALAELGEEND